MDFDNPGLLKFQLAISQTLASRTGILTLLPFDWEEIKAYQDMSDN